MAEDNWVHRSEGMRCQTCMWYVSKIPSDKTERIVKEDAILTVGRCRRHAPTISGWPVMFETDFCGDHKLDENKI